MREFRQEVLDVAKDPVADRPHRLHPLPRGARQHPVQVALAGEDRARVAAPRGDHQVRGLDGVGGECFGDTGGQVDAAATRLKEAGLATFEENDTSCCYALQDKVRVHGPGREPWEVYVVKGDSDQQGEATDVPAAESAASAETDTEKAGCCATP